MSQRNVLQLSDHRCVQTDTGLKYGNTFNILTPITIIVGAAD